MERIGGILFVLGVGSLLLPLIGYEFAFLSWLDNWGPTVGYIIKGGAALVGAALWFMGRNQGAVHVDEAE